MASTYSGAVTKKMKSIKAEIHAIPLHTHLYCADFRLLYFGSVTAAKIKEFGAHLGSCILLNELCTYILSRNLCCFTYSINELIVFDNTKKIITISTLTIHLVSIKLENGPQLLL